MRFELSETKTKSEKRIVRSKLEVMKKKLEEVRAELKKPGVAQENGILQKIKCIQGQSHWTSAEKKKRNRVLDVQTSPERQRGFQLHVSLVCICDV